MTAAGLTLLLCAIGFLICCSALFSGLETALFALKNHQIQRLEKRHPSLADFLRIFRDKPRRVLTVLLLGDTLVNVPLIILCLIFIWESELITHVPGWMATLAIFAVVVVLCDLIPKLLAISTAYRISAVGVSTLRLMMPLLDWVGQALENASSWVIDRLTPEKLRVRPRISDEELLDAALLLARVEGIFAAPEGGACVAAVTRLLQSGFLKPDERILIYNTGSGLKYLEAYSARFPRQRASEQDKLGGLITPR